MIELGSVMTAMATPFDKNGDVDLDGARRLARWLVEQGNDSILVTGTTGEANTLTDDEQIAVWRAVRDEISVPLVAGCGTNDTKHTVKLIAEAEKAGVDCALLVTPYYNRPSQSGIESHFRHACASTNLPVLIYDIPVRTGRKISTEVLVRLSRNLPNLLGVKDAAANVAETARLLRMVNSEFRVYSGTDELTLPLIAIGAHGVIGVCTHWATPEVKAMIAAHRAGSVVEAARINHNLIESYDFESSDAWPNPVPTKAMLRALNLPGGQCRLPMGSSGTDLERSAKELYDRLVERRA